LQNKGKRKKGSPFLKKELLRTLLVKIRTKAASMAAAAKAMGPCFFQPSI
jgi:hypothetical protein